MQGQSHALSTSSVFNIQLPAFPTNLTHPTFILSLWTSPGTVRHFIYRVAVHRVISVLAIFEDF